LKSKKTSSVEPLSLQRDRVCRLLADRNSFSEGREKKTPSPQTELKVPLKNYMITVINKYNYD